MKTAKKERKQDVPVEQPSRLAVSEYMPVIRAIMAAIEMEQRTVKSPDNGTWLYVGFLDEEFGSAKVGHMMDIMTVWLQGSKFRADGGGFWKLEKEARWANLLDLLRRKIMDFRNDASIIVLTFSESGRMTRIEDRFAMHSDFGAHSQTTALIRLLGKCEGYVSTEEICEKTGCAGIDGLNTLKDRLNKKLEKDLQLPKSHRLIESKRLSGYRVNQIYNIVFAE